MKKLFFLILVFIVIFTSCGNPVQKGPLPIKICTPINYGNNVYYFHCEPEVFAVSLSAFLSDGTKHVQSMTNDGFTECVNDRGYIVVIELKK